MLLRRLTLRVLEASCLLLTISGLAGAGDLTVIVTGHVSVTGPAVHGRSRESADAVVWLTPLNERAEPVAAHDLATAGHYQLVQQGKRFRPHILVVPVGAVVEFPNHDPFFHNVFSLFDGKRFDLGLYEAGSTKVVNFNSPGVSYIFCNIHPEMSAIVVAMKTPYYAVSGAQGEFAIKGVPPGRYEMNVWHERCLPDTLKALTRTVVLSPSSASLGEITLAETGDLLVKHKNKYGRDYDAGAPQDSNYAQP